jgi:hypothetical protein
MNKEKKWPQQIAITASVLVYIAVIAYAEVMFLGIIHVAFPEGLMRYFATAGAISTGIASIVLLLSIHYWLAPGLQFVTGIVYWAIAIIVMILNTALAFQLASNQVDSMRWWLQFSPSTPILNIIFIGILFLLDSSHKMRHMQKEYTNALNSYYQEQLIEAHKSDAVKLIIQQAAEDDATDIARRVAGGRANASIASTGNTGNKPALPKPTTTFAADMPVIADPKAQARNRRA